MQFSSFFSLLFFKTAANLRTEISRYYLNYLWWAIEPILTMGIFFIVFGIFLNQGTENYVAFLLTGLTAWNWFARTIEHASNSIYQGRGLMMQVNIPKLFFPLEVFLRDSFKHLFVTALLLAFLLVYPTPVSLTWFALPVLMVIQGILILGIGTFCAAIVPFVHDLTFVISTGLHLLLFGSGVFFQIEDVILPEHQFLMYLNPVAGLLKAYRDVLLYAQWPDWLYLGKVAVGSCCVLIFSIWLVRRLDHVYPRVCQQ